MRRGKVRTGSGVQAEVGVSDLHGCDGGVENPVLSSSAVAVVTVGRVNAGRKLGWIRHLHLNGGAIGEDGTLHIETLGSVTVGVNAVSAGGGRGSRSTTALEVPRTPKRSRGVGVTAVSTRVGEGVVDGRGEVESAVGASTALVHAVSEQSREYNAAD